MKRTVAAGFLALVGALWVFQVGAWVNAHLLNEAHRFSSFFMETLIARPAALLLLLAGAAIMCFGLAVLFAEVFKKGE